MPVMKAVRHKVEIPQTVKSGSVGTKAEGMTAPVTTTAETVGQFCDATADRNMVRQAQAEW